VDVIHLQFSLIISRKCQKTFREKIFDDRKKTGFFPKLFPSICATLQQTLLHLWVPLVAEGGLPSLLMSWWLGRDDGTVPDPETGILER
jgi:hypothetical protein